MSFSSSQDGKEAPYSLSVRPITDPERKAALDSLKPLRYNAIGMSVIGIMTAIVVNFGNEIVLLGVPLLFALMAGSTAANYKKNSNAIGKALAAGTAPEIAGAPVKKRFGGSWMIGPVTFANKAGIAKTLQEGAVSRVAFLPDAKIALSVNGIPLKRTLPIVSVPAGFGQDLAVPATPPQPVPMPTRPALSASDDLPPPPDDWDHVFCGECGQRNPGDARFCGRCGAVIKK